MCDMSCDVTCDVTFFLCNLVTPPVTVCDKLSHAHNRRKKEKKRIINMNLAREADYNIGLGQCY